MPLSDPSGALWGPAALGDTAERHRLPAPEGQALAALQPLSSKLFSRWRLPQRSTDLRRWRSCALRGSATVSQQPYFSSHFGKPGNWRLDGHTDSNVQLARETCHRHRQGWLCQSQSRRGRGRLAHRQVRGRVPCGAELCQ